MLISYTYHSLILLVHWSNKYNFCFLILKTDFSRLYSHLETKNNMINFIKDHIKGKISMREFFFITLRLSDTNSDYICKPKTINIGLDHHYTNMRRRFKKLYYICLNIDQILPKIMQLKRKLHNTTK